MKKRSTTSLACLACLTPLVLAACGGSPPPPATSVGPPPADTATTSSPKETLAQATTSGNVQIAQEILGACGISTADALFPFDSSHLESTSRGAMDATGIDEAGWARHRRVDVMLGS